MVIQKRAAVLAAANDGAAAYRRITSSQGNIDISNWGTGSRYSSSSSSRGSVDSSVSSSPQTTGSTSSKTAGSSTRNSTSSTGSSSGSTSRSGVSAGPGAASSTSGTSAYIEDSQITGPSVQDVTISENYYEDFGVYEESLNNIQFFYTTVANGGITDQSVKIDLPAGVDYVMEKDGVEIPWSSGQALGARGSYMLRLTMVADKDLPFSEQTIYKAVYRFRIQERLVKEESAAAQPTYAGSYGTYSGYGAYSSNGVFTSGDAAAAETSAAIETAAAAETAAAETAAVEESSAPADVMDSNGSINSEALDSVLSEALGDGYGTENLAGYSEGAGLSSSYDAEGGFYRHELASGEVFYTDVPNGALTNGSVVLMTDSALPFVVLKDGEQIEYEAGTAISGAGSYLVFPKSGSSVYLAAYSGKDEPLFHFRIVDSFVNDLGLVTAPQGGLIRSVTLDGSPLSDAVGREWYFLPEDGEYTVEFDTPSGGSEVRFTRDTVAPRFHCSLQGGKAQITYISDDVDTNRIFRKDEEIYSGNPVTEISTTGSYSFFAYDRAGNSSSTDITISYRMNTAAVMAILLLLLLLVALVVLIRRSRKQMKVV